MSQKRKKKSNLLKKIQAISDKRFSIIVIGGAVVLGLLIGSAL